MTHEEQLRNQNQKHWIRCCLGFKYLGEGLVQTVDTIVKTQHHDFTKSLMCSECDQCSLNALLPSHAKSGNRCTKGRSKCFCFVRAVRANARIPCPNNFCGYVYDRIVDNYLFSEPNWSNTDLTKWGSNYLEIAKCFIGATGYKDKQNIHDVDCSGLLNIIINNRAFESSVTKSTTSLDQSTLFTRARDDRNYLFHSPNMELSEDKLKEIIDNMLRLLNLPDIIDTDGKTKLSIENIQKIRGGNIYISEKGEKEVKSEYRRERKKELQLKLCDYYQRCLSTIPVSPVLKTISVTIDEVFVEFSIGTTLTGKQNSSDLEQVNLYKEILFKNEKLCKCVYLLGEAGMGKTTWCKKFLNTWMIACNPGSKGYIPSLESKADETSKRNEKYVNEIEADVNCLKQFDILFYIALRQESKRIHIIDMIKHHPVVTEYCFQTVVEDVLRNEPQSCVILLDGLDEWEPHTDVDHEIPSRECLHGCTVVTTSRKYRLVGIDAIKPDRLIEMTGVRKKELLVKNVIRQLNIVMKKGHDEEACDSSEEDSRRFIEAAKKMKDREISYQKTLPGYMDIPLMLIVMVCLWFDTGEIEDTITKNVAGMIEFMFRYARKIWEKETKIGRHNRQSR